MFSYRYSTLFLLVILGPCTQSLSAEAKPSTPDPLTLLQGVESSRLQIPPSRLKLDLYQKDSHLTNKTRMHVDFSAESRGFSYVADSPPVRYSTVFDGVNAACYDPAIDQVSIRSLQSANQMKLFDPRLLGISTYNTWLDSPENTIPYRFEGSRVEIVGAEREDVKGKLAWHIRLTLPEPLSTQIDYWVDDLNDFRVYRKNWNGVEATSFYESEDYPWLPSRVEYKEYREGELIGEREIRVVSAEADVNFAKDRWGLGGLGIEAGAAVLDYEATTHLGFWNGKTVAPTVSGFARADQDRSARVVVLILFGVFAAVPFLLWRFRKRGNE